MNKVQDHTTLGEWPLPPTLGGVGAEGPYLYLRYGPEAHTLVYLAPEARTKAHTSTFCLGDVATPEVALYLRYRA